MASEPAPVVETLEEGESETSADLVGGRIVPADEFTSRFRLGRQTQTSSHPQTIPDAATAESGSALPTEPASAVAGEFPPDDSTDSERDEASDDEIHDVALAVEKSGYSPHGHEVTSPPSDDDQGETIRIVTEAVEQSEPGARGRRAAGSGCVSRPCVRVFPPRHRPRARHGVRRRSTIGPTTDPNPDDQSEPSRRHPGRGRPGKPESNPGGVAFVDARSRAGQRTGPEESGAARAHSEVGPGRQGQRLGQSRPGDGGSDQGVDGSAGGRQRRRRVRLRRIGPRRRRPSVGAARAQRRAAETASPAPRPAGPDPATSASSGSPASRRPAPGPARPSPPPARRTGGRGSAATDPRLVSVRVGPTPGVDAPAAAAPLDRPGGPRPAPRRLRRRPCLARRLFRNAARRRPPFGPHAASRHRPAAGRAHVSRSRPATRAQSRSASSRLFRARFGTAGFQPLKRDDYMSSAGIRPMTPRVGPSSTSFGRAASSRWRAGGDGGRRESPADRAGPCPTWPRPPAAASRPAARRAPLLPRPLPKTQRPEKSDDPGRDAGPDEVGSTERVPDPGRPRRARRRARAGQPQRGAGPSPGQPRGGPALGAGPVARRPAAGPGIARRRPPRR